MKEAIDIIVKEKTAYYVNLKKTAPGMYEEAMWQYASMAHGGPGGEYSEGVSIRENYYKNYPDSFFFRVLSGLKEYEKYMKSSPGSIGIP